MTMSSEIQHRSGIRSRSQHSGIQEEYMNTNGIWFTEQQVDTKGAQVPYEKISYDGNAE